jgi:hypothetical protein
MLSELYQEVLPALTSGSFHHASWNLQRLPRGSAFTPSQLPRTTQGEGRGTVDHIDHGGNDVNLVFLLHY